MIGRRLLGIDFGTNEIKVYKKGAGIVLSEKNVIAMRGKKDVITAGNEAFDMLGKAPEEIVLATPIRNGVIADIGRMQLLLDRLLQMLFQGKIKSADYLVAVPKDITEVEKRAFYEVIQKSNAKIHALYAVDKPIAAALGMDIDITASRGVMTVDIGADTTEIAVISLEGIVVSKLIPVGGYKLDALIQSAVRKRHNLLIGEKTAENIKKALASAIEPEADTIRIFGRDVVSGLPAEAMIDSELVYLAIREQITAILSAIRQILERTPPEISADIIESGIYVCGGSANIKNMDKKIEKETNLKVNVAENAQDVVAKGLGMMVENHKLLRIAKQI